MPSYEHLNRARKIASIVNRANSEARRRVLAEHADDVEAYAAEEAAKAGLTRKVVVIEKKTWAFNGEGA